MKPWIIALVGVGAATAVALDYRRRSRIVDAEARSVPVAPPGGYRGVDRLLRMYVPRWMAA